MGLNGENLKWLVQKEGVMTVVVVLFAVGMLAAMTGLISSPITETRDAVQALTKFLMDSQANSARMEERRVDTLHQLVNAQMATCAVQAKNDALRRLCFDNDLKKIFQPQEGERGY